MLALAAGCAVSTEAPPAPGPSGEQEIGPEGRIKTDPGKADSSAEAVFVDFEFDGELITSSAWSPKKKIEDQLLHTVGLLNGEDSVGRLDQVELTNIEVTDVEGGKRITYHARIPVAWGKKNNVPTEYTMKLPRDLSYDGKKAFTDKYSHSCVDWGAHDVDTGSMWYYYRPDASRCKLADDDVVSVTAAVSVSEINTTGKYPEYHEVWKDDVLEVLAVFGKYEDGATTSSDAGISAYNRFVRDVKSLLGDDGLVTTPEEVPYSPGIEMPDITFEASLPDGKTVRVVALLVDNVRSAGRDFDERYEALSTSADLITYNGHAGLGANIRALARKGKWVADQYVVVFMNGCDTYAYVDSALADAHAAVNPGDPTGTKHLDIVTNAMPSFFRSMPAATMALVKGLMSYDEPKTYEQMFGDVDSAQVILVSGEQDNVYYPGYGDGGDDPVVGWAGLADSSTVAASEEWRHETPALPAGKYRFDLTGSGDADLYVRVGAAPSTTTYDCRPYRYGSKETCVVDLSTSAPVHVMVRGWDPESSFEIAGGTY